MGDLSTIVIPFELRKNPNYQQIQRTHETWINTSGIFGSALDEAAFKAIDIPKLVSHTFPTLEGYALDLFTQFMSWTFLYDDRFDIPPKDQYAWVQRVEAMIQEYRCILYGGPCEEESEPLLAAWKNIVIQIEARTRDSMMRRHRQSWDDVYQASLEEAINDSSCSTPSFHQYTRLRRITGGVPVLLDWVEICNEFELPGSIREDTVFMEMKNHTADVVDMVNDLYSLRKEQAHGNTNNAVLVLAHERSCSVEEAKTIVIELVKLAISEFQQAELLFRNNPPFCTLNAVDKKNVETYIQTMKDWMIGSFEWHKGCKRYIL